MQFKCDKGHIFHYPAKRTVFNHFYDEGKQPLLEDQIEDSICPFCKSMTFAEYVEPAETKQVENVFIYELTTGPQLGLDKLLAEGYEIVGRSVKLYQLEKCKPKAEATHP